jgi:hypothetical protein
MLFPLLLPKLSKNPNRIVLEKHVVISLYRCR